MTKHCLKPDWEAGLGISKLPLEHLRKIGIKALILDVDGTLLPRRDIRLHESVVNWLKEAKHSFFIHLLSNNPSKRRIESIAKQINSSYTYRAAKPRKSSLEQVMNMFQLEPNEFAIIGDRIFTDILAGNRLGIYTILIRPLDSDGIPYEQDKAQLIEQYIANILGAKN